MRIEKLNAVNLHGKNFGVQFDRINILTGDNYVGKTAAMKAIRLALTGWLPPPIGKTPGSIYKLAGNPEAEGKLDIQLVTDTGREIHHAFIRDAKGKTSTEGGVPADLVMPPLLCDPRLFFAMSGADRIKTIFLACDITKSGFGPETIIKRLDEIDAMPRKTRETTIEEMTKVIRTNFSRLSLNESAVSVVAGFKASQSESKSAADRASGSFQAFKTRLAQTRHTDKSSEITAVETQIQQVGTTDFIERERVASELEALKNNITNEFSIISDFEKMLTKDIAASKTEIDDFTAKVNNASRAEPEDIVVPEQTLGEINARMTELDEKCIKFISEVDTNKATLETVVKLKLCAKCSKALSKSLQGGIDLAQIAHDDARKEWNKLGDEHEKLSKEIEQIKARNKEASELMIIWENAIEKTTQRRDMMRAMLAKYTNLVAKIKTLPPPADTTALRMKLAELNGQQDAYKLWKNDQNRQDELEHELLTEQCKEAVYKAAVKIVLEEQEKVMTFAFNEVLKVAKHFTDDMLNSPLEFYNGELGRRVCKADDSTAPIGSWISNETFSGTETAIAHAGFSIALAQSAPMKIVFMDELTIIAPARRLAFLARMVKLEKEGVIEQFIGCSSESIKGLPSDVFVIAL